MVIYPSSQKLIVEFLSEKEQIVLLLFVPKQMTRNQQKVENFGCICIQKIEKYN